VHRPYHQSRRRRVPVALITTADGICHPTPAALIISRQRQRSIYPDRGRADRERTNENNDRDGEIGPEQPATVYLIAGGRAELVAATGVGVSQTDAGRPWAAWLVIYGWRQVCVASRNGDYGMLGILVEGGWSSGWSDGRRSGGISSLIG